MYKTDTNTKIFTHFMQNQADILTGNHLHLQNMAGHNGTLVKCYFNLNVYKTDTNAKIFTHFMQNQCLNPI